MLQLFEAGFAQNVFVCALDGVERQPAQRHDGDAAPEVGVGEHKAYVAGLQVLESYLAEDEEKGPCQHGTEYVEEDISDSD